MKTENKEIKFIRLVDGTDLISTVVSETETTITCNNAMELHIELQETDVVSQMVYLYQWLPLGIVSEEDLIICKDKIIVVTNITDSVKKNYLSILEKEKIRNDILEGKEKEKALNPEEKSKVIFLRQPKNIIH